MKKYTQPRIGMDMGICVWSYNNDADMSGGRIPITQPWGDNRL